MNFNKNFFLRDPLSVARDLLGVKLTTISKQGTTSGIIVEVEAYGAEDEASHSFRGITKRNRIMFSPGGFCYVYLIYGMHYCVNVVTEAEGIGSAVLIRALSPVEGIDLMKKRRGTDKILGLCSGPAKLCEALEIDRSCNGENLLRSKRIFLSPGDKIKEADVSYSERIGISKAKEHPWRILVRDSKYVSRKPSLK